MDAEMKTDATTPSPNPDDESGKVLGRILQLPLSRLTDRDAAFLTSRLRKEATQDVLKSKPKYDPRAAAYAAAWNNES